MSPLAGPVEETQTQTQTKEARNREAKHGSFMVVLLFPSHMSLFTNLSLLRDQGVDTVGDANGRSTGSSAGPRAWPVGGDDCDRSVSDYACASRAPSSTDQLSLLTLQRYEGRRPDLLDPARVGGGHGRPHALLPVLERAREPAARCRRRGHGEDSSALGLVDRAAEEARRRRAQDDQQREDGEPRHVVG